MDEVKASRTKARERTREKLIAAARLLFYSRDYAAISVDLIAREAGFTRAAFYLHFTGKDDILAAMMIAESHRSDAFFRWFERHPPTRTSIDEFLRKVMDYNRDSPAGRLFHLAALQNEQARAAFQANRLRLMALMGEGFPAFRPARDDSVAERRRVADALLATMQYEQVSVRQAEIGDALLVEQMRLALVDHFVALNARYPAPSERAEAIDADRTGGTG